MSETEEATPAIQVEHLVKRFPRAQRNAVDDISFSVRRGETFGLLGPNGAGKTTTIGILTTMVQPTGGRATIAGVDVVADSIGAKQRIAVVPQRSNLDRTLRVGEILTYHAAYHGVPRSERTARANALLEEFGLGERRKQKLGWFSGGMEQRVMLARALMHEPEVLFLDEPTNNLDPQSRLFLWERIRSLHERGVTVVLTTHDMEEADRLCERIAIMDQGRILALDTPDGLKRLIPGGTMLELRVRVPDAIMAGHASEDGSTASQHEHFNETLAKLPGVTKVERLAGQAREEGQPETFGFRVYASEDAGTLLASAAQAVIQEHGELLDLRVARPSLEDVFIYLTGRKLRS
jgi:ABC-2 type transport system ATP-binding protein